MNWDYLAGFFDAQGFVGVYRYSYTRAGQPWAVVDLTRSSKSILQEIFQFLNANDIRCRPPRKTKQSWTLRITRKRSIISFLENIQDRIIVKKNKVENVLKTLQN